MTKVNPKEINIVLSTDENYVKYCAITIASIRNSQKDFDKINIYILCERISDKSCRVLKDLSSETLNISLIKFDSLNVSEIKLKKSTLPDSTYYRLLIADLLPQIDKILYLDSDIIVRKSLMELWQTDISNYFIAATSDINEKYVLENANSSKPKNKYFNAGVLLLNLKKWREENALSKIKSFIRNPYATPKYNDQCILNFAFKDNEILFVDKKWNFHNNHHSPEGKNAAIIHYVWDKPWIKTSLNAYRNYYWKTVETTIWKNEVFWYKVINPLAILQPHIFKRKVYNFTKNLLKNVTNL